MFRWVMGFSLLSLGFVSSAHADQDTLNTSLRHAARQGLLQDVQKLLAEGAQVDAPAAYGHTALLYAALYGHTRVVRELLANGAAVNRTDYDDNTPLMMAAQNCNNRTVAALLGAGASVNLENHHGSTALTLAVDKNCLMTVGFLMRMPGIDTRHRDDWGKSALDYAREGQLEIGSAFIESLKILKAGPRSSDQSRRP